MGRPAINLKSRRFGRWLVVDRDRKHQGGSGKHVRWICKCDCGIERSVIGVVLTQGGSNSCGCLQSEDVAIRSTRHGMYGTKVYEAWNCMIDRCTNKKIKFWHRYGGRGIKVCDEWRHSFCAFYACMGEPPTSKHTLDRINNDGNYEPGNCRWATMKEQRANRCDSPKYKKIEPAIPRMEIAA